MRISMIHTILLLMMLATASAQTNEEYLYQVLQSVESLEGNFFQQVLDDRGEVIQEASGTVELKKPGKFRWHYGAPYSQHIVADGKNLWMLDLDLAQATVQPLEHALGSAPIILLTNVRPLDTDFEIREMPDQFGLKWIALVPKILDTEFYRIELGLEDQVIREMKLHDHFDQQTIIRFSQLQVNKDLPDSRFKFYIPDGVDVIGTPR